MALGKKKNQEEERKVEPHELISSSEVESIRKALIESHADLVVQGMLDPDVRIRLEAVVKKNFNPQTKGNPDVIQYVVRETIGTGVIEEILRDSTITDIGYNGKELIIESNDRKNVFDTNFEITEAYIVRLVNKFANANNKEFTSKNPIFDGRFDNVRINAVHDQNTVPESGTTMSLRVVRPRLALTAGNFEAFAPMFMLDFFKAAALSKSNIVISGTTGTGKTELHKLIAQAIPFEDRILLIEDTPETFMKDMFPDKDIYSWVTSEGVGVTELIKAGLRNHPTWIMVTETRGAEAYEMIQAVLSGHSIITSLHATNAGAIPSRFVNMAKMGYEVSEEALIGDIQRYFHFGAHIKKVRYNGKVIRYLAEVMEFDPDGNRSVFKQRFVDGVYYFETTELSKDFRERMEEVMVDVDFPESFKGERPMGVNDGTFETRIPLDATGRPDIAKIEASGTTLDILMGRDRAQNLTDEDILTFDTNMDGYIAPDMATQPVDKVSKQIKELKARTKSQVSAPVRPANTSAKRDAKLDSDIQNILDGMKTPEAPEPAPRKPQVQRPTPEPIKKSAQQILAEKRKKINNESV